ncbi:uncharacterized protein LOC132177175, partial [Corylus avellana]|uniref:uncharacterized protein LOC132177175 n=1 Tax=Corylus avellana TaxID=13451 RepID=UPI00286A39D7
MATVVGSERKEEKGTEAYSTASLPLGFQFNPTDEQLVFHYLRLKNEGRESEVQIIGEVDFYDHEPWDLPDLSVIKSDQREWFFFCRCRRDAKVPSRRNRATPAGYWKSTGKDHSIQSSRSSCDGLIGTKKTLVFYKGRAPKGTRTDWVMHEYSASATINYKEDLAEGTSPHQLEVTYGISLIGAFQRLSSVEFLLYSTPLVSWISSLLYASRQLDFFFVLIIGEVDVYDYEPWDLPDLSVIKSDQREWFFFCRCRRDAKVPSRRNRATLAGYWKSTGKDRSIQSSRSSCDGLIGTKKTLVFYKGRAPKGTRTNWIMHEYSASATNYKGDLAAGTSPHQDDFVLCRLLQNEWLGAIKGEKIHHTGSSIITTNSSYIGVSDLASEAVLKDGLKDQEGSTMVSSPSVPSKRTRVLSETQKISCLVDGCKADLNMRKAYNQGHRVCERHSKIPVALVGGIEQRFCQQCSRFHSLGEFDELKGSCRSRMAGHVMRRIKSRPLYPSSKQFVSNYKEEGIEKRITESQGEVLGVEAFEMKSNSGEKNEEIEVEFEALCSSDTFPLHHLFKKERFADTEDDKIFHTCSFADPSDLTVDPVQQSEGTSTEPI